ncbi:protein ALP1-like isoform X1 [Photinus pyralis]|nr:protein ALP1-like isoform X1 [Photinus pyralis]XP_031332925.1 protein ALP1-like isoform X1 [Photinus pyralis]
MDLGSSDEYEEEIEEACVAIMCIEAHCKRRSVWVHEINLNRENDGEYHTLIKILEKEENSDRFHMYFRMSKNQFNYLHDLIKDKIRKIDSKFRRAIGTKERLAVCLRFLATGNSFRSLGFSYKMGFSTVRSIIYEVCEVIGKMLGPIVMPPPTEETWRTITEGYKNIWNFPNCLGALDGKHINIRCPINSGSDFYNYKGNYSIVLLALVDANYKFIAIDVGSYGRNSDGAIFSNSQLGKSLASKSMNVPHDKPLVEGGEALPLVIVGDEAFPLKNYLLRPYSRQNIAGNEANKIFNYRLSRARRVVENAFGILSARWRIFLRYMEVQPDKVDTIVLASCCLHNLLCDNRDFEPENDHFNQAESGLYNLGRLRQNYTQQAMYVRDKFKDYFMSEAGSVPWQVERVRRGRQNM